MPLPQSQSRVRAGPSSPSVPSQRSPLKKHLQLSKAQYATAGDVETRASSPARSPQKLKTLVAANAVDTSAPQPSLTATKSLQSKALRASMLQVLLTLMDHEDAVLEQHVLPVLQQLATLRLESADVQRECLRALRRVSQSPVAPSSSVAPRQAQDCADCGTRRNSGRAKSRVDLRHCKEFLLACANEIHELEDVNPSFDYAEDTTSDAPWSQRPRESHELLKSQRRVARRAMFDYVSVVDGSLSSMDTEDDDADADQGTQLSEVLIRAEEMARECPSLSEREEEEERVVLCRRAFSQWRDALRPKRQRDARALATKFRAFSALKSHRAASRLSLSRKQRGLRQLKAAVAQQKQQHQHQQSAAGPSAVVRQRWLPRVSWELALALVVAGLVHTAM
ncbi:hypothetical protein PINS_up014460 [Pythium insidiosum]|nr:hypothetical protein PINS_up014460 [Pythium insidiosum]